MIPLDILTIYSPSITLNLRNIYICIPDIYPAELQLNKANTSDKETSFLDLNIKVIGSDIHTSVYDKRNDFGFPIVNFPWLSGDVPRLPSYGIYISQLVIFIRPSSDVTYMYYGMVMSVRPSGSPSVRPSVTVFRTFLLHALIYWSEILCITLFLCT